MRGTVVEQVREQVLAGSELTAAVRHVGLGAGAPWEVFTAAFAEIQGAGVAIQPLLEDPAVTDVLVNGDNDVWVDSGHGLSRISGVVVDARMLAMRLATLAGKRLDDAAPIVDGRLPDGTRLHAVLPPLAHSGAHISLRTAPRRPVGWDHLVTGGFLTTEQASVIDQLITSRANVLVSGAAGSGKTTLVAAVLSRVPHAERILIIEEAAELAPDHPHVVHLQSRAANVQGAGEVGLAELVRAAMRMRPDRLVLGECRGREVREVLSGFNTGHDGGWATVHANTAADVPSRLLALGALAEMSPATVAAQAESGLDAFLHVRRRNGVRFLDHIGVMTKSGEFRVKVALGRDPRYPPKTILGPGWPQLAARLDAEI